MGTFGTAADSKWRDDTISYFKMAVNALKNSDPEATVMKMIFNPVVPNWSPKFARIEAKNLASDAVILYGLQSKYSSVGSMAELGFLGSLSFLKSRKTMAFIDQADPQFGANVSRARTMSIADAEYIQSRIPESFALFDNQLEAVKASFSAMINFGRVLASSTEAQITKNFVPRDDIVNRIVISGTSGRIDSPERIELKAALHKVGIQAQTDKDPSRPHYVDTVRSDWTPEVYKTWELPLKDRSLVNLVLVSDQESYGAVKDVGMAVFRAVVNGSYAVIMLPEAQGPKSDYHRARTLVVEHWRKLVHEYPWVKHYVKFVKKPSEMAGVAATIVKSRLTLPDETWLGLNRNPAPLPPSR